MAALRKAWRDDAAGVLAYGVVLGLAFLYLLHRAQVYVPGLPPFWDARVYARALRDWRTGVDPYLAADPRRPGTILPFVSPPLFLLLMGTLAPLWPGRLGLYCYLSLALVCGLTLPWLISRFYLRNCWMSSAVCLFVFMFQPGKHGSQALLSGNLSNVLYAVVLAAGVPGLRRNRWLPFYLAIFFSSLMKPTFLPFLLLPLLLGENQRLPSLLTFLSVAAGNVAQWAAAPRYWQEFQANVFARLVVQGDAGFGLLGQFRGLSTRAPLLAHMNPSTGVLVVLAPLFVLLVSLRKRRYGNAAEQLWLPCLLVFAILSNPRILDYDADIAVLPAVYIVVEFCRSLPPSRFKGLALTVPLTFFLGLLTVQADTALCVLLVASVVLVIGQLLWPTSFLHEKIAE